MTPKDEKINRRAFFKLLAGMGAAALGFALLGFRRGVETEIETEIEAPHRRANYWRRLAG